MAWFSKKQYPDFWNTYQSYFKNTTSPDFDARFIVLDTETTGLDPKNDKILSIGAVLIQNKVIRVKDTMHVFLETEKHEFDSVAIHGIRKSGQEEKVGLSEAIPQFLDFIKADILVAHHASFDIRMLNNALSELNLPKLKNRVVDTSDLYQKLLGKPQRPISLDALCKEFHIPTHDRHTALGDAYLTAVVFQKLISRLKKENPTLKLPNLYH